MEAPEAKAPSAGPPAAPNQITLGGLSDAFEALQEFANQPLDGATAAKVVRLSRWARPHYLRYIAVRGVEAEKLGEKLSEGKFRIPAEKMTEFNQAMAPSRAELVEIDPSLRLDPRAMTTVKITPIAIEILEPFLTGL